MYLLYMMMFMYKCCIRIIGKRYYQLMTYLTISRHNTVINNDFLYLQTTYEQARETLVLIVYASSSGPAEPAQTDSVHVCLTMSFDSKVIPMI